MKRGGGREGEGEIVFLAATEDRGVELRMHGYDLASVLAEMQEVQPLCS